VSLVISWEFLRAIVKYVYVYVFCFDQYGGVARKPVKIGNSFYKNDFDGSLGLFCNFPIFAVMAKKS